MYILYCNTGKSNQEKANEYADEMAKKIADKCGITVVGIPVTNQPTYLELISEA